ncbi:PD-(D/E)XK motif protein [Limimaricola variabilis]
MAWAEADLTRAWRALRSEAGDAVWRLVPIGSVGMVRFEAGLQFPSGSEAVVVVFPRGSGGSIERLPDGQGFDVLTVDAHGPYAAGDAIALVRRPEGDTEIFETMAVDVLRSLERSEKRHPADLRRLFVRRVTDWQAFMSRSGRRPLSPEAQVGLYGELTTLQALIESGLGVQSAVAAWVGPRHAAQDFHIASGAIEVKSTAAKHGFSAKINSIEQLDTERSPSFMLALRFTEDNTGETLPELVAEIRLQASAAGSGQEFEAGLIFSRYYEEHAPQYSRRLRVVQERCFEVGEDFPCLRRAALFPVIISARYEMDLDLLQAAWGSRSDMMRALGVV